MRPRSRLVWLVGLAALVAASGCEEKRVVHTKTVPQSTEPPAEPAPAPVAAPAPAPAAPEGGHGFIVGRTTQDIKENTAEVQQGAQVASSKIVAKDPITMQGNAYVVMTGSIAKDKIDYALKLYQAENDRYPKDHKEFMEEIIKKNNITLPVLPHYQEYSYDPVNHKLLIYEYPARKANPPKF
jgi:hypothetical protein